jgi:hypothetical protein
LRHFFIVQQTLPALPRLPGLIEGSRPTRVFGGIFFWWGKITRDLFIQFGDLFFAVNSGLDWE